MDLPSEAHREVAQLMRQTMMTAQEIAVRTGIPPKRISAWNRRYGWRETAADTRRRLDPTTWAPARRLAVARLYDTPDVEPVTLAVALGGTVNGARALFRACGFEGKPGGRRIAHAPPAGALPSDVPSEEDLPSTEELGRALREHIARQIAEFDDALRGDAPAVPDSAKVLRDLGGLKRLLDDLSHDDRERAHATCRDPADGGSGDDELPALRAAIAARYAACLGERTDAGLPGEPAASADPGACLGLAP